MQTQYDGSTLRLRRQKAARAGNGCRQARQSPAAAPVGRLRGNLARALLIFLTWIAVAAASIVLPEGRAAIAGEQLSGGSVYSLDNPENITRLRVTVHKSQTIRFQQAFSEALIGESEIADVIPLTDRSLYVLGKKIGGTRLSILDKDKKLLGIIEIEVAYDAAAIQAQFKKSLPSSKVEVTSVNGKILLTGFVTDAIALEKAVAIASQYAPDAVTNSLTVAGSQQVLLEVRFVEASRTATRNLGVSWNVLSRTPNNFLGQTNLPGNIGLGAFPTTVLPFGAMVTRLLTGGTTADVLIQALEEKGLARRLAEPNLVALSGDTASFLAGGEFPFPVGREDDTITIEFKKFGVGLSFTPTVLANGLINLKIEPEVSEIDPNNTLVVNDTTIPGLVTRRAKTTVELRDGQSFAIAGLLQANHSKARRQLPWLGQVPVLGALFRSASFEKQETDLVIIVTPRLVKPAAPGDHLITPADKAVAGNDLDYFLNGKDEIPTWKARFRRKHPAKRRVPTSGHMLGSAGAAFPARGLSKADTTGSLPKRDVTGSLPERDASTKPPKKDLARSKKNKKSLAKKRNSRPKKKASALPHKKGLIGSWVGSVKLAFASPGPRGKFELNLEGGA